MKKLCIIGSLNIDLTISLPRFHLPGETITGSSFRQYTGGKGGNQAIAAAKLGGDVAMIGRVGNDDLGRFYLQTLADNGVNTDGVWTDTAAETGVALIEVDPSGENRIGLVPGANQRVDIEQIDALWPSILAYDLFLLQLEIPMETVAHTLRRLRDAGKRVILDPAPAQPIDGALWPCVDYITPNETELALLTGLPTRTEEEAVAAARALLGAGAGTVVAKRGPKGAVLVTAAETVFVPGFTVEAVDTTAAGDSFNAGFAFALSRGLALPEAIRYANAVGALSTTACGAQGAMPGGDAVEAFLRHHKS